MINQAEKKIFLAEKIVLDHNFANSILLSGTQPGKEGLPDPLILTPNGEKAFYFQKGSITRSAGYKGSEVEISCAGEIHFYANSSCGDKIGGLGLYNKNITIDDDQIVKCIKFVE